MSVTLFERKLPVLFHGRPVYASGHAGLFEGFGFSVASNALLIHPLPFLTFILEK